LKKLVVPLLALMVVLVPHVVFAAWSATLTSSGTLTVVPELVASASADKTEVATGEVIQFSSNVNGGKSGYTYAWDFNNDSVTDDTTANPNHSYSANGTYTVALTVTDALSNSASDNLTITVRAHGDANGDGVISKDDITAIEKIIMEEAGPTSWADANNDGKWNALDITKIKLLLK
jgi:PKD repeat protein